MLWLHEAKLYGTKNCGIWPGEVFGRVAEPAYPCGFPRLVQRCSTHQKSLDFAPENLSKRSARWTTVWPRTLSGCSCATARPSPLWTSFQKVSGLHTLAQS